LQIRRPSRPMFNLHRHPRDMRVVQQLSPSGVTEYLISSLE
jgi:hypothetical protein